MDQKRLASRLMLAGGFLEIFMGILHFIWPFQLIKNAEIAKLSSDYRGTIFLYIIAIGLCLVIFGVLSIYFAKKLLMGERSAWVYGISQGILWEVRTILELIFPVKIPLLSLSNPTSIILPGAFLLGLLFGVPLLIFRQEFIMGNKKS